MLHPQDLRFAVRRLVRRPGLTAAVVATLAIGIGAATTAFSLINAAFLRSPGVADPGRLVNLYTSRADGSGFGAFSHPDYRDLAEATGSVFTGVFGYSGLFATWNHDGRAESLFGEIVTGNYFDALGLRPVAGRLLAPDDDRERGQRAVVVIGHGLWQRRFAGDPAIAGRPMTINGRVYTIVGVAPAEFSGLLFRGFAVDVWAPAAMMGQLRTDQLDNREERWLFVRARLRPDAETERAAAAVDTVARRLAADHPETNRGRAFLARPSTGVWISPEADTPLVIVSTLFVGAGLVLLGVGISNLAGLIHAGHIAREREIFVQASLGATRGRLFAQMLAETAALAIAGGAAGLGLAAGLGRALSNYRPPLPVPIAFQVGIDGTVVVFAAILTVAAGALLALIPLRRLRRADAGLGFRQEIAGATGRRSRRHWLLVPQVAGSLVLLVLAGLMMRSVSQASQVDAGFAAGGVGLLTFTPGTSGLDEPEARTFMDQLLDRARRDPGVRAAAVTDRIPLDLYGSQSRSVVPDPGAQAAPAAVQAARVGDGYFDVFGIRVRVGRAFAPADLRPGAGSAIVNVAFAKRYWPGAPAVGRSIAVDGAPRTVVGVVADVKVQTLGEAPTPMVYVPLDTGYRGPVRLAVRADGPPGRVLDRLAAEAALLRPDVALFERRTMDESLAVMLLPFALASWVSGALGLVAMGLGAIGLHAIIAFAVTARTRELGIRLALGARPGHLVRAAARGTLAAAMAGVGLGWIAAWLVAQSLARFVFGISPVDVPTFVAAPLVVMIVAAAAMAGPLIRVLRMNPVAALRRE